MSVDDRRLGSEAEAIALLAPLAASLPGAFGLKDDCAVLAPSEGSEFVLTTDPIVEGVHFLGDDAPEDIAWKALAVNVSDLAAKAARPVAYLMAIAFPESPRHTWLQRFANGLATVQGRFGCALIGGDTDRRPGPLTIAITVLGEVPRGGMVRRATAGAGDRLFLSGSLGDAALGLRLRRAPALADAWGLTAAEAKLLTDRYTRPEPRLALAAALRAYASAAMDVSDGLAKDAGRLCAASGLSARIMAAAIPLSPPCAKALAAVSSLQPLAVAGGDDYEVLAAVPPHAAAAFAAAAAAAGIVVTEIGGLAVGAGLLIIGADGAPMTLAQSGWDHLA
jgi:thiamine-monophosphate kinase